MLSVSAFLFPGLGVPSAVVFSPPPPLFWRKWESGAEKEEMEEVSPWGYSLVPQEVFILLNFARTFFPLDSYNKKRKNKKKSALVFISKYY